MLKKYPNISNFECLLCGKYKLGKLILVLVTARNEIAARVYFHRRLSVILFMGGGLGEEGLCPAGSLSGGALLGRPPSPVR